MLYAIYAISYMLYAICFMKLLKGASQVLRMAGKRKAIDDFTPYFGEIENKDMYTSLVDDGQAAP